MSDLCTIQLGIGLGELRFGSSEEYVRDRLGSPDRICTMPGWTVWHYSELQLRVSFSPEDGNVVDAIETWNSDVTLWTRKPFQMTPVEIITMIHDQGLSLEERDEGGEKILDVGDGMCSIWVDDGSVDTIQLSPSFSPTGDVYIWPSAK